MVSSRSLQVLFATASLALVGCMQHHGTESSAPSSSSSSSAAPKMAPSEPRATNQVRMEDLSFVPEAISVPAGTKVTWVNKDGSRHTVTSDTAGQFDSGPLDQNQEFSHTFETPGTYSYHCDIHKSMTGKVIVK